MGKFNNDRLRGGKNERRGGDERERFIFFFFFGLKTKGKRKEKKRKKIKKIEETRSHNNKLVWKGTNFGNGKINLFTRLSLPQMPLATQ